MTMAWRSFQRLEEDDDALENLPTPRRSSQRPREGDNGVEKMTAAWRSFQRLEEDDSVLEKLPMVWGR
jgi:hypothetical protein